MKNKFFVLFSALIAAFAIILFMPDSAAAVVKPPPTPTPSKPTPPKPQQPIQPRPQQPQQPPVYQPPAEPPAYQPPAQPPQTYQPTCKNCTVQQGVEQYYPAKNVYEPSQTVNYYYEVNHYQDVNHAYHVQHNYYVRNHHYVYDYTQVHYSDHYYPTQYVRYPDTYASYGAPQYVHYAPAVKSTSNYNPCPPKVTQNYNYCNNCGKPGTTSYTNAAGKTSYQRAG